MESVCCLDDDMAVKYDHDTRQVEVTGCHDCPFCHFEDRDNEYCPYCCLDESLSVPDFVERDDGGEYVNQGHPEGCYLEWHDESASVSI